MHFTRLLGSVRVRFAPSPTGQLHLGGLRSALFNFLFARAHKGKFILRIEDTDQQRIVEGAVPGLERTLDWLGLEHDEGPSVGGAYGPYSQSERLDIYHTELQRLMGSGHAYPCFCTAERLALMRKEALKNREMPRYDGKCASIEPQKARERVAAGEKHAIRLKLAAERGKFTDLTFGPVDGINKAEGDPILMKSDGFPTYHFANVIDDHYMQISHVIRGAEWLPSTPKHVILYKAFGWAPPVFAHLSLLTNSKGQKLSKRHGDVFVENYKNKGYFPAALINFVTRNGDGLRSRDEKLLYSTDDLISMLDPTNLKRHNTTVDFSWLRYYSILTMKQMDRQHLIEATQQMLSEKLGKQVQNLPPELNVFGSEYIDKVLSYCFLSDRVATLEHLFDPQYRFFWTLPDAGQNPDKFYPSEKAKSILRDVIGRCQNEGVENISDFFKEYTKSGNLDSKTLMHFLRSSISGQTTGPPVGEMFQLLGSKIVVSRLQYCIDNCL